MIIGVDGNEANVEKKVGIGEYSFELLKKFEEFQISNIQFQIYLKNNPREVLQKNLHEKRSHLRSLKFDLASGKVKNVREIRVFKKDIARILTVLNLKKKNA